MCSLFPGGPEKDWVADRSSAEGLVKPDFVPLENRRAGSGEGAGY